MNCRDCIAIILTAFVSLQGCASLSTDLRSEDSLRENVAKEWQAKVEGNWDVVYKLATAKFKNSVEKDQFVRRCRLEVKDFAIKNLEISADKRRATVTIQFDTQHMSIPLKGMQLKETWVWEEGHWRLDLPAKLGSPFEKTK